MAARTTPRLLILTPLLLVLVLLLLLAAFGPPSATASGAEDGAAGTSAEVGADGSVSAPPPPPPPPPPTAPFMHPALREEALANATRLREAARSAAGVRRAHILEELAATYSRVRLYAEAASAREESLALLEGRKGAKKGGGGGGGGPPPALSSPSPSAAAVAAVFARVKSRVSLTQDLKDGVRYPEALAAVRRAQEDLAGSEATSSRYPALLPLLLRMEAAVLECSGDIMGALTRFARASRADPPGSSPGLSETLQHLRLLRRAGSPEYAGAVPAPLLAGLQRDYDRKAAALVAQGPWVHPQQLPKAFVPGLASRPWHSVEGHYPHLAPVERLLAEARDDLVEDLRSLRERGLLEPETECIHDAAGGGWRFHMLNGHWVQKDARGCSVHAPRACALVARIEALGVPNFRVLRGGFSAIDKASHLHPHCGITNAQLKFHLGLVVPRRADGGPCASIRVGNETRAWEEGKVLFFDDSWEHEVWNTCDRERAVFQLVFTHPDLVVGGAKDPFPPAAGAGLGAGEVAAAARTGMVTGGH